MIVKNKAIQFGTPTIKGTRIIAETIYQLWQGERKLRGDVPAKSFIARLYNIKTKDVNDCIKYCEKGKIKLDKVKKNTGKITAKDCDALWARAVKARAGFKCEVANCLHTDLQAHHIFSRQHWGIRFDLENGICLCGGHHIFFPTSAHKDAIGFAAFIKTKRNIPYLESKRGNRSKHDYQAIALYLQSKIKEFQTKKAA